MGLNSTGIGTVVGTVPAAIVVGIAVSLEVVFVFPLICPLLLGIAQITGSRLKRDGVCDREAAFDELRETGLEFWELRKSSKGISSERGLGIRGLDSRDRGVDRL